MANRFFCTVVQLPVIYAQITSPRAVLISGSAPSPFRTAWGVTVWVAFGGCGSVRSRMVWTTLPVWSPLFIHGCSSRWTSFFKTRYIIHHNVGTHGLAEAVPECHRTDCLRSCPSSSASPWRPPCNGTPACSSVCPTPPRSTWRTWPGRGIPPRRMSCTLHRFRSKSFPLCRDWG